MYKPENNIIPQKKSIVFEAYISQFYSLTMSSEPSRHIVRQVVDKSRCEDYAVFNETCCEETVSSKFVDILSS